MKILIDDPVKRSNDVEEEVIPSNSVIRFEVGDNKIRVKITEDGIIIHKTSNNADEIAVFPMSSNMVKIS